MEITPKGLATKGIKILFAREEIGLFLKPPKNRFVKEYKQSWDDYIIDMLIRDKGDCKQITSEDQIFPLKITLSCGCKKTFNKGEIKTCKCKHGNHFIKTKLEKE